MVVLYFSCNFDGFVQRGKRCLPTSASWPDTKNHIVFVLLWLAVLVCSGWYKQISQIVVHKQQNFFVYSSRGLEVQEQGVGRIGLWVEPAFWFIDGLLFAVLSHGGRGKMFSGMCFIKALIQFKRALPLWPNHPQRPWVQISHQGLDFNMRITGTGQKHCL